MLSETIEQEQMCEEAPKVFTWLLTLASILLVVITCPFSLLFVLKVVQEIILNLKPKRYFHGRPHLIEE